MFNSFRVRSFLILVLVVTLSATAAKAADPSDKSSDRERPSSTNVSPAELAAKKREESKQNLKGIALGLMDYEDEHRFLPSRAIFDKDGKPLLSWRVMILPYVEEKDLYKQFHLDEPWDSENNKQLVDKMPAIYADPQMNCKPGTTVYQVVAGTRMAFEGDKGLKLASFTDGTSKTIAVVEVAEDRAIPWTKPADWKFDANDPVKGLANVQPGNAFQAAYLDSHVDTISRQTDSATIKALFTRNGGEIIGMDSIVEAPEPQRVPVKPREYTLPELLKAQAAGRRTTSLNSLKLIALAMLVQEEKRQKFPARAVFDKDGKPLLSWRILLLPELEQGELYKQFHLDEPWDSENNKKLLLKMPDIYKDPQFDLKPGMTVYQAVVGPGTMFEGNEGPKMWDIKDGLSQTAAVVEVAPDNAVPWTKPDDWQFDPKEPAKGLAEVQPGGAFQAMFPDGSVRMFVRKANPDSIKALFTRNGGEEIDFKSISLP